MIKIKAYKVALKTLDLINEYIAIDMDYSLLQQDYNDLVNTYDLDLPIMRWLNFKNYDLIERDK